MQDCHHYADRLFALRHSGRKCQVATTMTSVVVFQETAAFSIRNLAILLRRQSPYHPFSPAEDGHASIFHFKSIAPTTRLEMMLLFHKENLRLRRASCALPKSTRKPLRLATVHFLHRLFLVFFSGTIFTLLGEGVTSEGGAPCI